MVQQKASQGIGNEAPSEPLPSSAGFLFACSIRRFYFTGGNENKRTVNGGEDDL